MSDFLTARYYAERLLQSLGLPVHLPTAPPEESAALGWARSGLMALTGRADGEPQMCAAPLTVCADGALAALASLAPAGAFARLRGRDLLAERAAIAGHRRAGAVSAGGSCRLLQAADGCFALNLARDDDWPLLPAWLEETGAADWPSVESAVRGYPVATLIARARELGLAAAPAQAEGIGEAGWFALTPAGRSRPTQRPPLVMDLSTLWAGPLCGHLLQLAGARVIKVESLQRPDGARNGPAAFFDLMNAGKASVALDLSHAAGREQLRALLLRADIVIESARPRALRQLGIHAEELLRAKPSLVWTAISGYGRGAPEENWIAYGDDAGVAAGLSRWQFEASGEWLFCGDAIADPLTGLHAALAALARYRSGEGGLLSLALQKVVQHCLQFSDDEPPGRRANRWVRELQAAGGDLAAPCARRSPKAAALLGADTASVLAEFGLV